jgi:hypothetical protein
MDSFSTEKSYKDNTKDNTKESSNIKNEEVFEYYYKKIVIKDYEFLGKGSSITHIEWFSRTTKRNREYNCEEEDNKYKKQKY